MTIANIKIMKTFRQFLEDVAMNEPPKAGAAGLPLAVSAIKALKPKPPTPIIKPHPPKIDNTTEQDAARRKREADARHRASEVEHNKTLSHAKVVANKD